MEIFMVSLGTQRDGFQFIKDFLTDGPIVMVGVGTVGVGGAVFGALLPVFLPCHEA